MSKAFTTDRTVRKYEALVHGKRRRWTKAEIHGLTKLLNAARWAWLPHDADLLARVRQLALADLDNPLPVTIERDHSDAGLAWLRRQAWRDDGTPRVSAGLPVLGERERAVLADFSHFTLDGWHREHGYEIIWRVHSEYGGSFAYVQRHWQQPYVVG